MTARLRLLVLGALPLGGAACGEILVDIAQRDLILDPVTSVDFVVDRGDVEVYAFERNGINLYYYMFGSLDIIGAVGHELGDADLSVFSECASTKGLCKVSWYAEIMLGTAVDVHTGKGAVKLTGVDGPITADVVGGGFDGVALGSPVLDVIVDEGDVVVEWTTAPMQASIDVGTGNVTLTLPAGSYRCDLDTADGEIDTTDVVCDDAATVTLDVTVRDVGDITLVPGA